jgi:hypothetical protein
MSIPKILHQTTKNKNKVPEIYQRNIEIMRARNPDWDYRLYDDADIEAFIAAEAPEALASFRAINSLYGAARADFFRYLVMFKKGGLYLDIKSFAEKPLNKVLREDDSYILSHWTNGPGEVFEDFGICPDTPPPGEYQQWHIAAVPGHPFLREVIAEVTRNIATYDRDRDDVGQIGVMRVTGPIAYTRAISRVLSSAPYRMASNEDMGFKFSTVATLADPKAHEQVPDQLHYKWIKSPVVLRGIHDPGAPRRNDPCPCGSGRRYKDCHGVL